MTVETHEDEARRMVMEITRRSVTVTAHLAQSTWLEVRQFVSQRLSGGQQEPRIGRRVTTTELEQATRGQRESVNLSDPRIAKLVQKELNRYGVTFAITRDAERTRVHIGAGNATQLDTAMRRAEQTLARQLEARQAREDRRAGRTSPSIEEVAADRSTTGPEGRQVQPEESPSRAAERASMPAPDGRYAVITREALPGPMAQSVLADSGWPALTKSLAAAEEAGLDLVTVLRSVVRERETFTSRSVAAVLAWRVDETVEHRGVRPGQRLAEPSRTSAPSGVGLDDHVVTARWPREVWPGDVEGPVRVETYQSIVRQALPAEAAQRLLEDPRHDGLRKELTAALDRGGNPVELLRRAHGGHQLDPNALASRVRGVSLKDAQAIARTAVGERARALPKGDVVDLATEKPGRGLDLGGPRR